MKKLSVLIALVLLAVAGTGYAVTCAYDNVPAASLLVPYWKVSLNTPAGPGGVPPFPIPTGGTDTLVSIVNVSTPGVIAHVTVWNKYSKAVIDFNIPLTGKDAVSFSMRDIMNGRLSPNYPQCDLNLPNFTTCVDAKGSIPKSWPIDPCGLKNPGLPNATYVPSVGFAQTQFIRFSHPDAAGLGVDVLTSISQYNLTAVDAIGAGFRGTVWGSLDESGDVSSFTSSGGANILDQDNPACQWGTSVPLGGAALSGYLTIDVVNYCTNFFPDQADFYNKDAIATAGWTQGAYNNFPCTCTGTGCIPSCAVTYTPNVLIGDVFYVDSASVGGNVSGDPAVPVEFDSRLTTPTAKTFFGKFVQFVAGLPAACAQELTAAGCQNANVPVNFRFGGDGREPLGDHYGFRYLADQANGLQSWITVWRSDVYFSPIDNAFDAVNLCEWADPSGTSSSPTNNGDSGSGLYDTLHQVVILTYDNDENLFGGVGVPPGPSGQQPGSSSPNYIFLESQRIDLLAATTAGTGWNPQPFKGGWVDITLRGPGYTGATVATGFWNQGWVGVQHTAPGAFISVGHAASNLNNQFQCQPNFQLTGGTNVGPQGAP
jgi:hypothetical protein